MAFRSAAGSGLNQSGDGTGFTITIPADVEAGDVLMLFLFNREADADATVADDDSGGEAWVKKGHVTTQKDAGATGRVQLWWKRATPGTAATTITVTGCTGSSSGVLAAYSGRLASGDPFNVFLGEDNAHGDEAMWKSTIRPVVEGAYAQHDVPIPEAWPSAPMRTRSLVETAPSLSPMLPRRRRRRPARSRGRNRMTAVGRSRLH